MTLDAEVRRSDDTSEIAPIQIPPQLMDMLSKYPDAAPSSKTASTRMLLSWLLMCNFFQDTVGVFNFHCVWTFAELSLSDYHSENNLY